jgi:hypothetical protein
VIHTEESIKKDVERIGRIAVINTLLEVVVQTTGMGFAAVARVTRDRWVACGIKDDINFGSRPGDELKIETTICNEIRDSGRAVIIEHVSKDEEFCDHHTPKMYGFQSYISMPIFLQDGAFFGTLCAIDPKPAQLKNDKIIGMFTLFAQLISFHLAALRDAEITDRKLNDTSRELSNFRDEIRQYQYLSNHNFQEPLRKIRLFTDILLKVNERSDEVLHTIRALPGQIARLFYHLISNSLKYGLPGVAPQIRIYSNELTGERLGRHAHLGIGLAQCRRIARNNGGLIAAQSEPGKGTTFSVILPIE